MWVFCESFTVKMKDSQRTHERWGAGVETQKNVRGEIGDGVEYHLVKPTPRR